MVVQVDRKVTQPIVKYLLMFAIQYNSIALINTQYRCHVQQPTHVTSCCKQLPPVRQLSSNSRSSRMYFSQVQRVFIAEHCTASRSHLTWQNELRDTFSCSPVPNRPTVSCPMNCLRDTGGVHRVASEVGKGVNACIAERNGHFHHLIWHFILFSDLNVIYFSLRTDNVSGMGCVTFRSPCINKIVKNYKSFLLFTVVDPHWKCCKYQVYRSVHCMVYMS
jgi:hypothetical protein